MGGGFDPVDGAFPARMSEAIFSNTFEHAPIGIARVEPGGRWLKVNRALCEITGYSRDQLLSLTYQDITHPDDRAVDERATRALAEGLTRNFHAEKRYLRPDGSVVPVRLNVSLVRDDDGRPQCYVCHIEDISSRTHAEAAAQAQEDRFRRQRNAAISFSLGSFDAGDIG